jgi:hypothetical protein
MKLGSRFSSVLEALELALGIVTIILGLNEATFDVLDRMGSNYWLAYSSVISGVVLISLILHRHRYRSCVAPTIQKNTHKRVYAQERVFLVRVLIHLSGRIEKHTKGTDQKCSG